MQCHKCGAEQSGDSLFCTKCGTKLSETTGVPTGQAQTSDEIPVAKSSKQEEEKILRELKEALKGVQEPQPPTPTPQAPPPPIPAKIWMAGGFVALLTALIIVVFIVRSRNKEPQPTAPTAPLESVAPPPTVTPAIDAETRSTVGKIAAILEALDHYSVTRKSPPPALTSLNKRYSDIETLKDGWGHNIYYLVDLTNKTFVIRSPGPDGKLETSDDLTVTSESADAWAKEHEQLISEWRVANPNIYEQLISLGPSDEERKKQEAARKAEEEKKKRQEESKKQEAARKAEEEKKKRDEDSKRQEAARKAEEDRKREEDSRQLKAREEELRRKATAVQFRDNFTDGLTNWDAPSSWEIVKDQDLSVLRVQGLGLLRQGESWDNYKTEFDVKVNKESAGWVVRAQNTSNFYLFKLGSEKAKAIPKNSLVRYIFSSGKYLNSLKREDAPGAAGVVPLPFKVRNKDFYKVVVALRGNTITHSINGIEVDSWSDRTFDRGRFGFNASIIEMATIRNVSVAPLQ
jgi:flagellar motor protein MotB